MGVSGENKLLLADGSGVLLLALSDDIPPADALLLAVIPGGTSITNSNTFQTDRSDFTICQRSGFKAKPDALVQEWNNLWVLPRYAEGRNIQDFVRSKAEEQPGPRSGEQTNDFITTRVLPEDL